MKNRTLATIWFIIACVTLQTKAEIYTYFTDLFDQEPVPTEYSCYTLLKDNPIRNRNYLAVPWTILMKNNMLDQLPDIKLDGGFTICQHFRFEEILPLLRRIGIDVLFTPHIEKGKTYEGITVLPFPHYAKNGTNPAKQKDILYSFVGTESKQKIRRAVFKLAADKDVVIIKRKSWGARTCENEENKEYRTILSRSRFALCPRGYGASTIRFWEALQAGAIPILLADAFDLPLETNWNECCIRIPEVEVFRVDEVVRSISPEQEESMRTNCLTAYALYSGENIVSTIRAYYATCKNKIITKTNG